MLHFFSFFHLSCFAFEALGSSSQQIRERGGAKGRTIVGQKRKIIRKINARRKSSLDLRMHLFCIE